MQAFYLPLFLKAEKKFFIVTCFLVTQQLLFMLILAYLQIDLCLFCAMPAVNKDIWRKISILKRKALLSLPIAHLFLLHFRPNVCSPGKVCNGKLLEEMSWTWNARGCPSITLNICTDHSELYCLHHHSELVLQNTVLSKTHLRTPRQFHS